jgi:2-aminoethylphosphonate-pyruvate transaminase
MHDYFYSRGITIYPGKLDGLKTFRIANMGDITYKDIETFLELLDSYLTSIGNGWRKEES